MKGAFTFKNRNIGVNQAVDRDSILPSVDQSLIGNQPTQRRLKGPRHRLPYPATEENIKKLQELILGMVRVKQKEGESARFNQLKGQLRDLVSQNVFTKKHEMVSDTKKIRDLVSSADLGTLACSYSSNITILEKMVDGPKEPY